MSSDVNMQGTLTADAVPIEANGTVVVKIKNDETMIRSAVEQFNCGREALKDTIGFDMTEVMRANTFEARTTRNVHMDMDVSRNEPEGPADTPKK